MVDGIDPVGVHVSARVRVAAASVQIRDLSVRARAEVDYLTGMAPDKRELALAHALEVGIAELLRRRNVASELRAFSCQRSTQSAHKRGLSPFRQFLRLRPPMPRTSE